MRRGTAIGSALALLLLSAAGARPQARDSSRAPVASPAVAAPRPQVRPAGERRAPLLAHVGAATAGSLAGVGVGVAWVQYHECHAIDRLSCDVPGDWIRISLGSVLGAVVGDQAYGRVAGDAPSALGASLGAVAGMVAGWYVGAGLSVLTRRPGGSTPAFIAGWTVTQGAVSAWAGRAARRRGAPRAAPPPRAPPPDSARDL